MESINSPLEETVSNDSCSHLNAVADDVNNNYHLILAYYVTCIAEKTPKRKADDVFCRICNGKNKRIHACLECAFFGCFDEENGCIYSHMKSHAVENKHYFAININHGYVFCFKCNDYVYNKTFEEIMNAYMAEARRINGSPCNLAWKPKVEEIAQLRSKIIKISDKTYFGLRGIINFGNTCYVNCIIQIFIANPLLRDFFLSDKHKCWKKATDSCLICEMFILFQEFNSGITDPYDPFNFFRKLKKLGDDTQGACHRLKHILEDSPQDAFELYYDIVTGLLLSSCQETVNCNCIIHEIFSGINRTSTECLCGAKSWSLDNFTFISLEGNNDSLVEILKRKYFEPEVLTDVTCSLCKKINQTSSMLTIEKLPAVICFFKSWYYFEGVSKSKKKVKEVKSSFTIKEWIDMSDYLNSKDDVKLSNGSQHTSNSFGIKSRYYLFGVVIHKTGEERNHMNGHYISFVKRCKDLWFECDDQLIYQRNLEYVLACKKPVLLFYYKQM